MPWLQIRITTNPDQAEPIEQALVAAGAVSVTLEDNADQPILEPALGETPLWNNTLITGLFPAGTDTDQTSSLAAAKLGGSFPEHRWEILEDKDWEREWMKHYHPLRCGERLWICPSWQTPPEPESVNLLLDPGLAFGTGTHPTTFLCLKWLDEQHLTDKTIIDYGCGSGILAIGALLLGARSATCVDNDPQALIATADNAGRNHLSADRITSCMPEKTPETPADILVANILAGPLVTLAPNLANLTRPGGKLCLSGIIDNQAEEVMAAYHPWFDFNPPVVQDQWVRLTAIKR